MQTIHRQGGWMGLLALVFVLAVVAFLAKNALKQYGVLSFDKPRAEAEAQSHTGRSKDVLRGGEALTPNALGNIDEGRPMDRVRQLGNTVKQQAEEIEQRIDNADR